MAKEIKDRIKQFKKKKKSGKKKIHKIKSMLQKAKKKKGGWGCPKCGKVCANKGALTMHMKYCDKGKKKKKRKSPGRRKNPRSVARLAIATVFTSYFSFSLFTTLLFDLYKVPNNNPIGMGVIPVVLQVAALYLLYPSFKK